MRTNRVKSVRLVTTFWPAITVASLIVSCSNGLPQTEVDSSDTTPPELAIVLAIPENINASYTDTADENDTFEPLIDTSREFNVEPQNDSQQITLIFRASDEESGVSQIRAQLEVSFRCSATVLDRPMLREVTRIIFSDDFFERAEPGDETDVMRLVSAGFSYEDLWQRGQCTRWGGVLNVGRGRLSNIQVKYRGRAWNNSVPSGEPSEVVGQFAVADGDVNLQPQQN